MLWFRKKNKEKERYYLLAGMGGRSARRKRLISLRWGIATGIVVSIILGLILYLSNHPK